MLLVPSIINKVNNVAKNLFKFLPNNGIAVKRTPNHLGQLLGDLRAFMVFIKF